MTTYADTVYSALLTADAPMSSRGLYEAHDTFESPDQVNKAVAYLVKTGRAEMVGTTKPKRGKTVRLYRALSQDAQAERAAPADLDRQLAEAIRERDTELSEAVIEPQPAAGALIGEWPNPDEYTEERPVFPREWPDALEDRLAFASERTVNALHLTKPSNDPIINAMRRMQIGKPCIHGIERDIRRARALSRVIGDAGPDVSGWLNELADKLEYIA